jgi:hypothetical protein
MSHHFIFLPQASIPEDKTVHPLTAVGLADHVACADRKPIPTGPDGGPGLLYAWLGGQQDKRWHYSEAEQDWTASPPIDDLPAGRFYVGVWKNSPPSPEELTRPGRAPWGEALTLGDGRTWMLPPADLLPKTYSIAANGQPGGRVKPEYQDLLAERDSLAVRLLGPPTMVPPLEVAGFLTRCLAVNYRIEITLALHLGLFDEQNIESVLIAALQTRDHYLSRKTG